MKVVGAGQVVLYSGPADGASPGSPVLPPPDETLSPAPGASYLYVLRTVTLLPLDRSSPGNAEKYAVIAIYDANGDLLTLSTGAGFGALQNGAEWTGYLPLNIGEQPYVRIVDTETVPGTESSVWVVRASFDVCEVYP